MLPPGERPVDQDLSTDLCLALALGAKYGTFEAGSLPNDWYAKALLRLWTEYRDDLSLMRTLTLICLFEIDDDVEMASQFLSMFSFASSHGNVRFPLNLSGAALCLGKANGFDTEEVPLQRKDETERHQWLRLWETMRFLNLYGSGVCHEVFRG